MPKHTLVCDQAIFTSIRTPMGEGYRIIATSKGLGPKDKQAITQRSPSHEGLCAPEEDDTIDAYAPLAVSFYQLPSSQLCVAISCFAGAEHTGRGGQRIYTHCVIFPADQFSACAFNPFNIAQAMVDADLTTPTLKPPPQLETLSLQVSAMPTTLDDSCTTAICDNNAYLIAIDRLLRDKAVIVNMDNDWLVATEAIMMSLPGPMRERVSFGSGLRYSTGRHFHLNMLSDETGVSKARSAGQRLEYLAATSKDTAILENPWLNFIARMWKSQAFEVLAKRTCQAFNNVSDEGRMLIAKIYNSTDGLQQADTLNILQTVQSTANTAATGAEAQLLQELMDSAECVLYQRFSTSTWTQCQPCWPILMDMVRASEMFGKLAFQLIPLALQAATKENVPQAFTVGLQVARILKNHDNQHEKCNASIAMVLEQTRKWLAGGAGENVQQIHGICDEWKAVCPAIPVIDEIASLCREKLAVTTSQ